MRPPWPACGEFWKWEAVSPFRPYACPPRLRFHRMAKSDAPPQPKKGVPPARDGLDVLPGGRSSRHRGRPIPGINTDKEVRTCPWFESGGEDSARFYVTLPPDSRIDSDSAPRPASRREGAAYFIRKFRLIWLHLHRMTSASPLEGTRYSQEPHPPFGQRNWSNSLLKALTTVRNSPSGNVAHSL